MFKSPLNYVGGKFKLLPTLLPQLRVTNRFVDLFCGGANVSINVNTNKLLLNDTCCPLIDLYKYLKSHSVMEIQDGINVIIEKYSISKTNQEGFLSLRASYNQEYDLLKFFVLVSNSFNHQIRFNSAGEFNMPFGRNRSYFNDNMKKNLSDMIRIFHDKEFEYTCRDFRDVELEVGDFVYCDPPYNLSTAVYNTDWHEEDDADLCSYLDAFHLSGGKFALSCVLEHNQQTNTILSGWAKKYQTHLLEWKYKNSNYHKRDRSGGVEAVVVNY